MNCQHAPVSQKKQKPDKKKIAFEKDLIINLLKVQASSATRALIWHENVHKIQLQSLPQEEVLLLPDPAISSVAAPTALTKEVFAGEEPPHKVRCFYK